MPVAIQDGTGSGFDVKVGSDNRLWVDADAGLPTVGTNPSYIFAYSGTAVGSIFQYIDTGSYVQVFGYNGSSDIIDISSWSVV